MSIIRDYLARHNLTQYEVATFNGLVPNAIQRQMDTSPDKVTTRTYHLLANVLHQAPEHVFHEIRGMTETHPITLNQLRLEVRNYWENRPGVQLKTTHDFETYVAFTVAYYRDNGKKRTLTVTARVEDGLPSLRSDRAGGTFYLYAANHGTYRCDLAVAEILDRLLAVDNAAHPL